MSPPPAEVSTIAHTAVLVEGESDRSAVHALARRHHRDLDGEGVVVVAMGGATNIRRFVAELGPGGRGLRLVGLYDAAEERFFRRALSRAELPAAGDVGGAAVRDSPDLAALGFFRCVEDLEDELIRALGTSVVESVLADQDELKSFRSFQRQPAQRNRPLDRQLRRFMGTRSGRKVHFGRVLVEALDLRRVPRPLDDLLTMVSADGWR